MKNNEQIQQESFKMQLARVFDDNLHTRQWHNYVDYAIMGLILLSTLEVFLSTYDGVMAQYGRFLFVIDWFTTIVFTIEVSLRIWCADILDPKYKGIRGRLRYCFSFYGIIDILSTYPFYINFLVPVPYTALKVLRIARLLRIFRYMKAFNVLSRAIRSKKNEMVVSLQFLTIVTLILSFILFFVEHEVQPEVYDNGWISVLWAFAQYIGDPGNFADTPPVTFVGRVIACIIGVLGIAIFAVPAGLIGSAFSEVMENDEREEKASKWAKQLRLAFERKLDRPTGYQVLPRFVSIVEAQARLGLKEDEILEAVNFDSHFRLINLASTIPADLHPDDRLAVELFNLNTTYGQCVDRGSRITIFSPSDIVDPIMGWWSYYVAMIGGFNYVSREVGTRRPYKSFYIIKQAYTSEEFLDWKSDMNRLLCNEKKWVFTLLAASGAVEPELPTQVHFCYGGKKGDETYDDPNITLNDIPSFDALFKDVDSMLQKRYGWSADRQRYHDNSSSMYFARHLDWKVNAVSIRVAWSVTAHSMRAIELARDLSLAINRNINHTENPDVPVLKQKAIGYDGYDSL